jgi:hypothetical protein
LGGLPDGLAPGDTFLASAASQVDAKMAFATVESINEVPKEVERTLFNRRFGGGLVVRLVTVTKGISLIFPRVDADPLVLFAFRFGLFGTVLFVASHDRISLLPNCDRATPQPAKRFHYDV